jgi:hypothetical protein
MLSEKHIESFLPLNNLEVTKVFYLGKHFGVRSLSLAASFVANFIGLGRREYVVILKAKKMKMIKHSVYASIESAAT